MTRKLERSATNILSDDIKGGGMVTIAAANPTRLEGLISEYIRIEGRT